MCVCVCVYERDRRESMCICKGKQEIVGLEVEFSSTKKGSQEEFHPLPRV